MGQDDSDKIYTFNNINVTMHLMFWCSHSLSKRWKSQKNKIKIITTKVKTN